MRLKTLLLAALCALTGAMAQQKTIVIDTDHAALVLGVGNDGRVRQKYLGRKLLDRADYAALPAGTEAYVTHGMEDYYEPALHVNHADGNPSTLLTYAGHTEKAVADGVRETVVTLTDTVYGTEVRLCYTTYAREDVFKLHTEITNRERKPVSIEKYASAMLGLSGGEYYLTQYNGDWANEANRHEQRLEYGKKVIDTKLGTRANMFVSPFFQLALGAPAAEETGTVLTGTLGWTGNFRFTFEQTHDGDLRLLAGINPYASRYTLKKDETFRTPEFIFTISQQGTGQAARNLHDWARLHQLKDGTGDRMTLLNNWEATYFGFDEEKLVNLIGQARELGVDMFLLDDGWFGEKYPRNSDRQGLGDWTETRDKLPGGIGRLTEEARKQGVKFGLWIEPEMVNPKSELYERHKDWVITLPGRKEYYYRNQLVLDLANPKVQDYVFSVVDGLMSKYPDIAFFKWDCNSPITNIYSNFEGKDRQQHLYVDYVRGLYNVLGRIRDKYPSLPMMLCSGGGGRSDYEALKYFTEFWPSDNTDPVERLFIQWGFSQVFPVKAQCAHVTSWNSGASIKFRTNVAMMGKLGFDIRFAELPEAERNFCKQAVKDYNRLKGIILDGDRYGLVSPYSGQHTATLFADKRQERAVLFTFDLFPRYNEHKANVRLRGLDARRRYAVTEISRMNKDDRKVGEYSGDFLMTVGLPLFTGAKMNSRVFEVVAL